MYLPNVPNIYFGDDEVQKVFLGNELVWPAVPYEEQYFTIYVLSGGTLFINRELNLDYETTIYRGAVVDYSVNGGAWQTSIPGGGPFSYSPDLSGITVSAGDTIRFRSDYTGWNTYRGLPYNLTFNRSTCYYNAYGNMNSLVYADNFLEHTTGAVEAAWAHLFENSNIVSGENLYTPGGTYGDWALFETFYGCTHLLYPPTIRASYCPSVAMTETFYRCTSLRTIKLPNLASVPSDGFARWVHSVPATGTFVKKQGVVYPGYSGAGRVPCGIPNGWTVIEV